MHTAVNYIEPGIYQLDFDDDVDILDIPVTHIARASLAISNGGVDIPDAFDVPFYDSLFRVTDESKSCFKVLSSAPNRKEYIRDYDIPPDVEDPIDYFDFNAWLNEDLDPSPSHEHLQIAKTSTGQVAPEIAIFKASTFLQPMSAAIKFVVLVESFNADATNFIHSFEDWWDLPRSSCSFMSGKFNTAVKPQRALAMYSKRSTPIYGFDNLAGKFAIARTGLSKDNFLTEKELRDNVIPSVDFGRLNAMVRYIACSNYKLDANFREISALLPDLLRFTVNPAIVHKYTKEMFEFPRITTKIGLFKSQDFFLKVSELLNSKDYLISVLAQKHAIDFTKPELPITVKDVIRQIKGPASSSTDMSIFKTAGDMIYSENLVHRAYKPIIPKATDANLVIDVVCTKSPSDPKTANAYGSLVSFFAAYSERAPSDKLVMQDMRNALTHTIDISIVKSTIVTLNDHGCDLMLLFKHNGVKWSYSDSMIARISRFALKVSYLKVRYKVMVQKDKLKFTLVEPSIHKVAFLQEVNRVSTGLSIYASFYQAKSHKLRGVNWATIEEKFLAKIVMYSFLAIFYTNSKYSVANSSIVWADEVDILKQIIKRYCKRKGVVYNIPKHPIDAESLSEAFDLAISPVISFKEVLAKARSYKEMTLDDVKHASVETKVSKIKDLPSKFSAIVDKEIVENAISAADAMSELAGLGFDFDLDLLAAPLAIDANPHISYLKGELIDTPDKVLDLAASAFFKRDIKNFKIDYGAAYIRDMESAKDFIAFVESGTHGAFGDNPVDEDVQ